MNPVVKQALSRPAERLLGPLQSTSDGGFAVSCWTVRGSTFSCCQGRIELSRMSPSAVAGRDGRADRGVWRRHLHECAELLVSAFNTEPWNDSYTPRHGKEAVGLALEVRDAWAWSPSTAGSWAFAIGYRSQRCRDVFHLSIFCVRAGSPKDGVGQQAPRSPQGSFKRGWVNTIYLGNQQRNTCRDFLQETRLRG
jgi:hypothetical protein